MKIIIDYIYTSIYIYNVCIFCCFKVRNISKNDLHLNVYKQSVCLGVGSRAHTKTFASTLRVLDRRKSTFVSVDAVSRTALNVRFDLERSAVVLDRMKRTVVSVDAVSRTALNVGVDLERSAVVLDRMKRTVVSVDAVSRTRTECLRWP
jgi:hypothetical protein